MELDRCTHEDYLIILTELKDFWGTDRARQVHHPMFHVPRDLSKDRPFCGGRAEGMRAAEIMLRLARAAETGDDDSYWSLHTDDFVAHIPGRSVSLVIMRAVALLKLWANSRSS